MSAQSVAVSVHRASGASEVWNVTPTKAKEVDAGALHDKAAMPQDGIDKTKLPRIPTVKPASEVKEKKEPEVAAEKTGFDFGLVILGITLGIIAGLGILIAGIALAASGVLAAGIPMIVVPLLAGVIFVSWLAVNE